METYKLDLSKLTPVAEKDRVRGNWYVVADRMSQYGRIEQFSHKDRAISFHDGDTGTDWKHWFAIPPNLPGFPVQELPDIIKLPLSEWSYSYSDTHILLHRKPRTVGTLVLPAGTIEERKKRLQEELDKLGSI